MTRIIIIDVIIIFIIGSYSFSQQIFVERLLLCASSVLGAGCEELGRFDTIPVLMELSSSYNVV